MTTILFGFALVVAIASIALLPHAKGGARSGLLLLTLLAGGALVVLLTGGHVL